MQELRSKAVIICGTTASGKSSFAIDYALKNNGEIINIDSLQIYKELPIVTASPTKEDLKKVPHHLFNFIDGKDEFSVGKYLSLAKETADEIISRGKLPVFVGGSGFYISAVLNGLHELPEADIKIRNKVSKMTNEEIAKELEKNTPEVLQKININDRQRLSRAYEYFLQEGKSFLSAKENKRLGALPYDFEIICVSRPKDEINERIEQRIYQMLDDGMEQEIKNFLSLNIPEQRTISKADGVQSFKKYFDGLITKQEAIQEMIFKSKHYAKRQRTWYKHQLPENTIRKELIG